MAGERDDWERIAAGDPRTHPQQLSELANRRWDLHGIIAANPRAFPELIRWIAEVNPGGPLRRPPQAFGPPSMPSGPVGQDPIVQPPVVQPPVVQPPVGPGQAGRYPAVPPIPVRSGSAPLATGKPDRGRPDYVSPVRGSSGGAGWWLAGCGCLVVFGVGLLLLVLFWVSLSGAAGAGSATGAGPTATDEDRATGGAGSDDQVVAEQLALFEEEQAKYDELLAQLDGNPVAPLVVNSEEQMLRIADRSREPGVDEFEARSFAYQAAQYREELEQVVAVAADRREQQDGSLTERIVVRETGGFVEVVRDAESACGEPDEGTITTGCVFGADPLTIHLLPESGMDSDWEREMLVIHELAHVYRYADLDGVGDGMVDRGLFQGSDEKMADCYALTYYDRWELSNGETSMGYGYVCDESERTAIREWAEAIDAPMPR